jgi:phosphate-selective porin
VGVNWYLNDYIRMMLDGAWTRVFDARDSNAAASGSSNDIFGVGARAQVDW